MSTVSLLNLPVELHHRIFDYLDTYIILRSVRCVSRELRASVNVYNRFELKFDFDKKCYLKLISCLIRPSDVISLNLSNGDGYFNEKYMNVFLSNFEISQFSRLRSLTLDNWNSVKMDEFFQHITINGLVSLTVNVRVQDNNRLLSVILPVIVQSNLRKLHLISLDYITEEISWPIQSTLEELTIRDCTYHEYRTILCNSLHLRKFRMRNCIMDNIEQMVFPSSVTTSNSAKRQRTSIDSTVYRQLISLTFDDCQIRMRDLEILLSLTPSLAHLTLVSSRSTFDSIFDGSSWEQFIQNNLPFLNKYQFFLTHNALTDNAIQSNHTISFDSHISPFCSPFWVENKHWFVTCACIPRELKTILYTTSDYKAGVKTRSPIFEVSSTNSMCRFILHSEKNMVNNIEGETPSSTLDLSINRIGGSLLQYIFVGLSNYKTLTILNLSRNYIGDNGAQYLAAALEINQTLRTLYLNWNHIGNNGVKYLSDALRNNRTLTSLDLEDNQIGDIGVEHLADSLRNNRTLTNLGLGDNRIGDMGVQHLADSLRNNKTLITLDLQSNQVGDNGVQQLDVALKNNRTLKKLVLVDNSISKEVQRRFEKDKKIFHFRIYYNPNYV